MSKETQSLSDSYFAKKISLDLAPLFARHYGRSFKTGIYRYASNLMRGLIKRSKYEITCVHPLDPHLPSCDIYHSLFHIYLPPKQIRQNPKIQTVVTIHDLIPWLYPEYYKPNSKDYEQTLKAAKHAWLISPSHATKEDLVNYLGVEPGRIFVTPLGIDPNFFYPRKSVAARKKYGLMNKPYFLFVGRIEERKGVDLLLKAFSQLVMDEKMHDLNLVLCGPLMPSYSQFYWTYENNILKNKLERQIHHFPFIPEEELPELYSHAEALVFLSHYEGFGFPPLEAMRCHTPSICLNTSSLPEVVGEAGLLLKDSHVDTVSDAMKSLYGSSELSNELITKGADQLKPFTWENTVEQTLIAYTKILSA